MVVLPDHELPLDLAEAHAEGGWVIGVSWTEGGSGAGGPMAWWARLGDVLVAARTPDGLMALIIEAPADTPA